MELRKVNKKWKGITEPSGLLLALRVEGIEIGREEGKGGPLCTRKRVKGKVRKRSNKHFR